MRRFVIFISLLGVLLLCAAAIIVAPNIGLGAKDSFVLYRTIGINRTEALSYPLGLSFLLVLYKILSIGISASTTRSRVVAVLKSAWIDGVNAAHGFMSAPQTGVARERWIIVALIAGFGIVFSLFFWKYLSDFQADSDQYWHCAVLNYAIDWGTPVFSLGGNILYHFDIQVPLNPHLLPLEGLASAFPIEHRMVVTIAACFLVMGVLVSFFGSAIGLRPIPRTILAGLVALLLTVPRGLDMLIWIIPPNFFTRLSILALWWLEAPIIFFATVLLFFWLGQRPSWVGNFAAGSGFVLGSASAVLGYPAGGIFFIPLILVYCVVLLLTSTSQRELAWKVSTVVLLATVGIVAHIPQFLYNLYAYSFDSYFMEPIRGTTENLLANSSLGSVGIFVRS